MERASRTAGRRLGLLATLLLPFLTVYSAQGCLEADRRTFINAAAVQEFLYSADYCTAQSRVPTGF